MENTKLSVHHIGGRRGTSALCQSYFQEDCSWTFYDADESCLDQIKASEREAETKVLPYCLFSGEVEVDFKINADPSTNSIFDFNEKFSELYLDNNYPLYGPMDYRLQDTVQKVKEVKMKCTSLDLLADGAGFESPDVLSIDAQGAAFEILKGAENTLINKTIAVCCEAEFIQIYKDQKLFSHVSQLLDEKGFVFAGFLKLTKGSMYRESIGVRGDHFHICADVLFLKEIDSVVSESRAGEGALRLYKLAYTALVHGYVEYAAQCARVIKANYPESEQISSAYAKIIDEFYSILQKREVKYHQSFHEVFSPEASARRFSDDQSIVDYDSYSRLVEVLGALGRKVKTDGGKEILIVTYKRFGERLLSSNDLDSELNYTFDYAIPDCEFSIAGKLGEIPENAYILLTASHKTPNLKEQLKKRGISEDKIFVTGHWVPDCDENDSELEVFFRSKNLGHVAYLVKEKRINQSYKVNPILP